MKSAHDKIKAHLKSGRQITGLVAWKKFSCYRLSSVINRLRSEGMNIKTTIYFQGKEYSFASYRLVK